MKFLIWRFGGFSIDCQIKNLPIELDTRVSMAVKLRITKFKLHQYQLRPISPNLMLAKITQNTAVLHHCMVKFTWITNERHSNIYVFVPIGSTLSVCPVYTITIKKTFHHQSLHMAKKGFIYRGGRLGFPTIEADFPSPEIFKSTWRRYTEVVEHARFPLSEELAANNPVSIPQYSKFQRPYLLVKWLGLARAR